MKRFIPGTSINFSEQGRNSAFSLISPVLEATGGLTLSQLSKLTVLEGSTIQNWIKRGWVSSPKGKKYSEKQVVRILLINMLKGSMKLEQIAKLMTYINGDVEDTSDDIIEDVTLYNILCRIIFTAEDEGAFESDMVRGLINRELTNCAAEIRSDEDKLRKAMYVMVMAYRSSCLKAEMETELCKILSD
ncbi:MAG: DUF1836 domain-containing protein [Ruminococcus sp.]|nr:DUF1836 domain-containing protein [Ruminococcus sp.]